MTSQARTHLTLSVLGTFELEIGERRITALRTTKARALLAYLFVQPSMSHSRDVIAALLWPDKDQLAARHNLRQTLSILRDILRKSGAPTDVLLADQSTIQLNPIVPISTDIGTIEQIVRHCKYHSHQALVICAECAERLEQVAALYHGPFLAGLDVNNCPEFESWAVFCRERIHRVVMRALHDLASYYEVQAKYTRGLAVAQRQIALEPWREEAYQQEMRLLLRMGERSAALMSYKRCRQMLAAEFETDVSAETQRLHQKIVAYDPHIAPALPVWMGDFGRNQTLASLHQFVQDPSQQLLTICGLASSGKMQLATRFAHSIPTGRFLDGIWWVDVSDDHEFEALLAQHKPAHLRHREMLFVLARANHRPLLANWIAGVRQHAPHVKLLVTARERLHLPDEQLLPLAPPSLNRADARHELLPIGSAD